MIDIHVIKVDIKHENFIFKLPVTEYKGISMPIQGISNDSWLHIDIIKKRFILQRVIYANIDITEIIYVTFLYVTENGLPPGEEEVT